MTIVKNNIKYFEKCVKEAINFFGLHSYSFNVREQIKPSARASNYYHSIDDAPLSDGRVLTICYSLHWINQNDLSKNEIRMTAFHEVFESMFYRLRDFSNNTDYIVSPREVDAEIHTIVRTFENKILPLIKEDKMG